ncbi:MAG: hypothetical protein PHR64_01385 [Candidatus Shapirobacteria bacterium]|nr:hypothetical protein [Candidatus Shapirobacteria bacterium]MDD5481586.1 hypothetical protein [Candidatus Shapirobacteria bacterium]
MYREHPWWHWVLGAFVWIAIIVIVALGVRYFWPREVEKIVEVPIETEKIVEVPIETDCTGCQTIYVDLEKDAPEGVWSNASGLLLAEGWCAVFERDQTWQEANGVSWEKGATRDHLLICNPGPGSRFFSLQDEYGGRPKDWWNDQAKKAWFFCLTEDSPNTDTIAVIAVLYEHDDERLEEGWEFPILLQQE